MRIAVTGASGNVGTQLLRHLRADPTVREVVAVCRRPPERPTGPLGGDVRWVALDLSRPDVVPELVTAVRGCDALVHLAWLIQPSHAPGVMRATNVEGSRHVLGAVREAGVPAFVYASSVGVYSPGPKDRRVDESWPTDGIPGSLYSAHKAEVERMVDRFEAAAPRVRVARLRPGVVVSAQAASEQVRYFLGPFLPAPVVRPGLIPVVPDLPGLAVQIVHSEDVGRAFARAATTDVRGAFNVAAEPVLTPRVLGEALHARPVRLPTWLARGIVGLTWKLRMQPTDPGWVELALRVPLMGTGRARTELGWAPAHDARDTLLEALDGVRRGAGGPTPALRAITSPVGQLVGGARSLFPRTGGRT